MKKKIVSIFVSMLLFVTVVSVTGAMNIEKASSMTPKSASTPVWSDDFDSYANGSPLHGQGEWKGWDNNPAVTAYVTNNQSRSSPHSVDIAWFSGVSADMVHEFSGVSSGNWTFTAWQYIPNDFSGETNFLLLNTYNDGGPHDNNHWSNAVKFSSVTGNVHSWEDETLPIIFDQWVEIRVEIDFEADLQTIYYGGEELITKSWTAGVAPGGAKNLACVDLYASDSLSTSVYYDDLSLEGEVSDDPDLDCEGDLSWVNVSTGEELTGSFTVENIGGPASLLDWKITKEPSWGTWTFDPDGGDDLAPGAPVTVDVTVIAPDEKNEEFSGRITIENKENPEDVCHIDVSLSTPKNKAFNMNPLFLRFLERHPHMFPILRHMLGL